MAAKKYGDLVKKLNFRKGMGGANARELVFVGGEELGGFELNFIVGVYDQTGDWAPNRGAHAHSFDECLLFFGYDDNDLSYLGSDMKLSLGKELEEHNSVFLPSPPRPKGCRIARWSPRKSINPSGISTWPSPPNTRGKG